MKEFVNFKDNNLLDDIINLSVDNYLNTFELYITHFDSELKLIDKQKAILLKHKPFFLFKTALNIWNRDIEELEEIKIKKLENYSKFINLLQHNNEKKDNN